MRVRELIRIHIDHISDDNARLSGCAFIYGQDILPENADKEDLDGTEEKDGDHNLRNAKGIAVPEEKLPDEYIGGIDQTDDADREPDEGGDAHQHFGVGGDAVHREVIIAPEIEVALPSFSFVLLIGNGADIHPVFINDRLQIGGDLLNALNGIQKFAVIQTISVHVLQLLFLGKNVDDVIVAPAGKSHECVVIGRTAHTDNDLVAGLPFCHEFRKILRRVLQISEHQKSRIAVRIAKGSEHVAVKTEIGCIEHSLAVFRIFTTDLADELFGMIRRSIIDINDIVLIVGKLFTENRRHTMVNITDAVFFVIAWNNHADLFHKGGFLQFMI